MANRNGKNGHRPAAAAAEQVANEKRRYLEGLAMVGTIQGGIDRAHIGRQKVYEWQADGAFRELEEQARDKKADELENVAMRRAADPDDKFGHILLIFMLKAARPGKFRDNVAIAHSGTITFAGLATGMMEDQAEYDARLATRSAN